MLRLASLAAALFITPTLGVAQSAGDGYWSTQGSTIVDASGNPIQFSGVNWNGFESGNYVVHGLWGGLGRSWDSYLDQMDQLGFNLIRLPFSGDMLDPGRMPQNIDYGVNPDLQGLTSIEIMDKIVDGAGARGIRIILDYHRIEAGFTPEWGLWYDAAYPESEWIANWKFLVTRYLGNPTVVGVDLFNEVHSDGSHPGPFWSADGTNEPYNWRTAAKRCADAIQAINPELLICVQGMDAYNGEAGWWGAVLLGVKDHPLVLTVPNKLVYSVHDYGPIVWDQPFHQAPDFPNNLPGHWDHQWGFVHDDGIAPIWIGEWGAMLDPTNPNHDREILWLNTLQDYILSKGLSWTWWTWTPNSGDTGGILTDDWTTTHQGKLDAISPVMYPGFAPSNGGAPPPTPPPSGQTPFGGTARALPGTVEAEDFDEGGAGTAFNDTTPGNAGGAYRTTDVDIEASSDVGGGFNVGWLDVGEWLEYTVDVTAGSYTIDLRVASALTGGTLRIEFDGVDATGSIVVPGTGGWQTWQSVTVPDIEIGDGLQEMRIVFESGSFNLNSLAFTQTASSGGGSGGSGGGSGGGGAGAAGGDRSEGDDGCGTTGAEPVLLLLLAGVLRRRRV